jgi:hypothetical protein
VTKQFVCVWGGVTSFQFIAGARAWTMAFITCEEGRVAGGGEGGGGL